MKPIVLIILDGWGIGKKSHGNAVYEGNPEFINFIRKSYPTCRLKCSGKAVGLPKGFQGNSEVGHINIGAGRVVYQMLEIINRKIKDKTFFKNKAILKAVNNCRKNSSALHLMGMISDEGVHSHQKHLFELLKMSKGINVKIHLFTDGRDTLPKSASKYITELEKQIKKYKTGKITTISGRYYAMDRDNRWQRTEEAYNAIAEGKGEKAESWKKAVLKSYKKGITDEFIKPSIIGEYSGIKNNDSVIFFNYRLDRARQLTHALIDNKFTRFKRKMKKITFCAFAPYYQGIKNVAFQEPKLPNILGEVISRNNLKQFRIAETEKYAHVTFFFNGENEKPFPKETRCIIPSPKVATYEIVPEMSAYKITEQLVKAVNKYDVLIANYANGDMIGHTGNYKAALKAVKAVDKCVKKVYDAVKKKKGIMILAADHGNCEQMINKDGSIRTSHTKNDILCSVIGVKVKLKDGKLANIAPTILELLGIKKPREMDSSLLKHN